MPVAIPFVIAAVGSYALGTAAALGVSLGISTFASSLLIGAASFALNSLGSLMAPKPKLNSGNGNGSGVQTQQFKQPVGFRQFIYGEVQTSGEITFFGNSSDSGIYVDNADGTNNGNTKYMHLVIVLATHQCDSIDVVWFNTDPIYVTDLDAGGNVTSGKYAGYARIKKHLGAAGQTVDTDLLNEMGAAGVDNKFTGSGCTYLYIRLTTNATLYPGGAPTISAWVRGALVYDPRSTATAWSPNPALCLRDFAQNTVYGLSIDATRIPDTYTDSTANTCEEIVNTLAVAQAITSCDATANTILLNTLLSPFQTGDRVQIASDATLPSGLAAVTNYYIIVVSLTTTVLVQLASTYANALTKTAIDFTTAGTGHMTLTKNGEPRYTANGAMNTGMIPSDVINNLLSSMAGDFIMVGGQWLMKAGVYVAPDVSLTEKDCHGAISTQTKMTRRERFNRVQGLYTSPANLGQTSTYPLVSDSTYLTEDKNIPIVAQLDLTLTSRAQTAQRIARIQLNRNRRQRTVQFTGSFSAMQVQATGTFNLSHVNYFSGATKIYEVSDFSFVPRKVANVLALTFDIIAHQTDSGVYTFDETTQEIAPSAVLSAPINKGTLPQPPGAPILTEALYSTTDGTGVKAKGVVAYSASPDALVRQYQVEYQTVGASAYTIMPLTQDVTATIFDMAPGQYNIRVKGITLFGKESVYANSTVTVQGLSARPVDMTNFSIVSLSNDATASWDAAVDLDVKIAGTVRLRHTPDIVTPSWTNARDICDQLPGITTQVHVPLVVGTYMAKFVDSTGNESLNAAMIVINNTQIFNLNVVATSQEDTTFPGTKTNMIAIDSVLRLDGGGLFDSGAGNFDSALGNFDQGNLVGQQVTGSYVFQSTKIDAGAVAKCWVTTSIALTIYNSADFFDSRSGNFDDAIGLFDGTGIVGITVQMLIRTTNDNPNGSPTWSAWMPFVAGYFTARGFDFKLTVASVDPAYQCDISALSATVDVPDVTDSGNFATSAGTLATVTYNKTFTHAPTVVGIINDAQAGDQLVVPLANVTASNFQVGVLNSGVYVVRNIVWYAKGY